MKANNAFRGLVKYLKRADIPHMVTGSIASSYYGVSRATLDVDLVIDPKPPQVTYLANQLTENGFYVSESDAQAAIEAKTQFNVIHMESVWKIDLIIRKDRPFSEAEFKRRESASIMGVDTFVASAEDLILAKLEWSKESGSERQRLDIEGIIEIKGNSLNRQYMEKWAKKLDIYDAWTRLQWKS